MSYFIEGRLPIDVNFEKYMQETKKEYKRTHLRAEKRKSKELKNQIRKTQDYLINKGERFVEI